MRRKMREAARILKPGEVKLRCCTLAGCGLRGDVRELASRLHYALVYFLGEQR